MAIAREPAFRKALFNFTPEPSKTRTFPVDDGGTVEAAAPVTVNATGELVDATDGTNLVAGLTGENLNPGSASRTTPHPAGAEVTITQQPGTEWFPVVANGESIPPYTPIVCAGSGQIRAFAGQTDAAAGDSSSEIIGRYIGRSTFAGDGTARALCVFAPVGHGGDS